MDKQAIRRILWAVILTAVALIVMNGEKWFWSYYPFRPAVLYSFTTSTEPGKVFGIMILNPGKTVYPGGEIEYQIDMDKKMDIAPIIKVEQRNTFSYIMAPFIPPIRPLGRQKVAIKIPVPRMAEYGKYTLYWTAEYLVGPDKRTISLSTISEPYWVIPDPNEKTKGDRGKPGPAGKNFWGR